MQDKLTRKPWWVYMVQCADGTYYTGSTPNVGIRLDKHNHGKGAKYTRSRLPVVLVFTEECQDKSAALKREIQLKKLSRLQKQKLVAQFSFPQKVG